MWKTVFFFRAATKISPQANVEFFTVFHRHCFVNFPPRFSTEIFSTFHRGCGEKLGMTVSPSAMIGRIKKIPHSSFLIPNYKQELMLAVMSRILFWVWLSPFFRATSTLRMAYRTVEWSLANSLPMSGKDRLVSFRIRYMATCRASAVPLFFWVPRRTTSSME